MVSFHLVFSLFGIFNLKESKMRLSLIMAVCSCLCCFWDAGALQQSHHQPFRLLQRRFNAGSDALNKEAERLLQHRGNGLLQPILQAHDGVWAPFSRCAARD